MNKNKSGFVSMTLVYTFLIVFLFLMLAILNTYNTKNKYIEAIDGKVNDDIKVNRDNKDGILNRLITDHSPSNVNIVYHKIANLEDGNFNGFYYSKDPASFDEDGDGTVLNTIYFFRGEVDGAVDPSNNEKIRTSNYIALKDNNDNYLCFRALRTDESGNVKMIYNGPAYYDAGKLACHERGYNQYITVDGESEFAFNNNAVHGDSDFKYMYSETGSLSISSAESNAKKILDKWFGDHFASEGKITDTVFCNNSNPPVVSNLTEFVDPDNPDAGQRIISYYNPYKYRVVQTNLNNYNDYADNETFYNNSKFRLLCNDQKDRFTLSKNVNGNNYLGNQALSYPVGLLTLEEAILAGGRLDTNNVGYFLNHNVDYWTMSPYSYDGDGGGMLVYVDENGALKYDYANTKKHLIPVIAINKSARVSHGKGSYNDPYVIN